MNYFRYPRRQDVSNFNNIVQLREGMLRTYQWQPARTSKASSAVSEGMSIHRLPSTLTEAEGPVACFMCLLDKPVV